MSQRLRRCRAAASPALMHGMCPDRAEMKLGRREASAQRITNHVQVAMIVTTTMLATLCQVRKSQLGGPIRGAQGCTHHVRRELAPPAPGSTGPLPTAPSSHKERTCSHSLRPYTAKTLHKH